MIFCLSFIGAFLFLWLLTDKWIADGQTPVANGKYDYAIVLGAKVNGEIPSLALQYRLEAALTYATQYPDVQLILSGGQGSGENISEALAMERFLLKHGIQKERLLVETQSTSTYENILFSKELLSSSTSAVTIITSDFHLARAKIIAKRLGLESDVVAADTPQIVEKKLRTRERIALIKTFLFGK